jgi:hypothetical protein
MPQAITGDACVLLEVIPCIFTASKAFPEQDKSRQYNTVKYTYLQIILWGDFELYNDLDI